MFPMVFEAFRVTVFRNTTSKNNVVWNSTQLREVVKGLNDQYYLRYIVFTLQMYLMGFVAWKKVTKN